MRDEGFGHICGIKSDIWDLYKILDPLRDLESGMDLIWTLVSDLESGMDLIWTLVRDLESGTDLIWTLVRDLESGYRSGIQIEIWDPN